MAATGGLTLNTVIRTPLGDRDFGSINNGDWVYNRRNEAVRIWFDPVGLIKNPYKVDFPSKSSPMRSTDFYVADASHPLVLCSTKTTAPKLQKATDGQYRKLVWLSACVPVQSGPALAAEEHQDAAINKQEDWRGAKGLRDGAQPPPREYDFDSKGSDPDFNSQVASSSTNDLSSEAWRNDDSHDSDVDLIGWLRGRGCDCGGVRNLASSSSDARSATHFLEGALSPIAEEYIEPQLLFVGNEVHITIDQYLNARHRGHNHKVPFLEMPLRQV